MVRWEEEMKKQVAEDTMMDMNAELCSLKVRREETREKVWVRREMETIRYKLLRILVKMESSPYDSIFEYLIYYLFNIKSKPINQHHRNIKPIIAPALTCILSPLNQ